MLYLITFILVSAIVVLLLLWRFSFNAGRNKEKLDNAKEIIKDQDKGNKAVERAKRSQSIIDKLRKRYGL